MAVAKTKVNDIAKELNVSNKDLIEKLALLGIEVKNHASVLENDQLGMVLDIYTQLNDIGDKPLVKPEKKVELVKAEPVQTAPQKEEKQPEKVSAEEKKTIEKKTTESMPEKKAAEPAARTEKQPERKPEKPQSKPQMKQPPLPKKKKEEAQQPAESIEQIEKSGNAFVVETKSEVRYVDTRTDTVELEKIETTERLETLVADDISKLDGGRSKKKKKNKNRTKPVAQETPAQNAPVKQKKTPEYIEIPEEVTVGDLASRLDRSPAEIVKKLLMLGIMATVTQSIDFDTAALIAEELGIEVRKEVVLTKEDILFTESEDKPEDLVSRPPVVVVMGHVDHGKTSLLDAIRNTSVIATEAGGITQHIGAYSVRLKDRDITFLDTPGHEAFTTMRARGAQVTDVAILVVAADDGIMPQTIEAINHAKAAGVTIVVAINKIDKDGANVERVKQMMIEHELVPEEWGGDTVCVEISAKKNINIDGLLEMVLLIADMKDLKANPNKPAKGTVIEAQIDKGRGPVATILVQEGTLSVGDIVIAGTAVGHVRAMVNDKGRRVKTAGPSVPVEILGLSEAPSGGDNFHVVKDEKLARDVAESRRREQKESRFNSAIKVSLDNLFSQIDEGNMKELNVIIKADVQGSVEAVRQSLEKLSNEEVRVRAIHGGVGAINESDVMLANASNAIIVGFNVRPDAGASAAAKRQEVDIRLYRVIYQAIEEIEAAMKGMLDPEFKEVVIGHAEVRQTFKVTGVGTIAGSYVTDGKITRNAQIRLVRDGIVVHEGEIDSLKRFKDDAKEVAEGYECGIGIDRFNDVKDGDVIECFVMEEIER